MRSLKIGVMVLFLSVVFAIQVNAQSRIWGDIIVILRPPTLEETRGITKQLNLTGEQKKEMKDLNQKYHDDLSSLKEKYQIIYNDLLEAVGNPNVKMGTVQKKAKKLNDTHEKILEKEIEYWNDVKEILDPEQYSKMWNLFTNKRLKR